MIKKLTVALLLLSTGTLFAQISNPVAATFAVKTAAGVEAEMPISLVQSLSPDLPYYFNRNVVQQWGVDVYPIIANAYSGVHGDSTTNYLTDNQSIGVYCPDGETASGMKFACPYTDWTHWTDKDTMELGETYFAISIRLDSTSQARLGASGIMAVAGSNWDNAYRETFSKASLSEGWNHIKGTLSLWDIYTGTPNWNSIDSLYVVAYGTLADGDVIFLVDNVQLVRADPDAAAEPNPFQSEGPDGTWTEDWTQEGAGNIWIVEESEQLGVMSGDAQNSYLLSAASFGDYSVSGTIKANGTNDYLWHYAAGVPFEIGSTTLSIDDSTGAAHSTPFNAAAGDLIYWKYERKGTSVTGSASFDGITWTTLSTFGLSGLQVPRLYLRNEQRRYSLGLSAIAYAAEAGVAQRLEGIHFYRGAEGLEITIGDSTYFMVIDSVQ